MVRKNPQTVVYMDGKVSARKICWYSTMGTVYWVVRTGTWYYPPGQVGNLKLPALVLSSGAVWGDVTFRFSLVGFWLGLLDGVCWFERLISWYELFFHCHLVNCLQCGRALNGCSR